MDIKKKIKHNYTSELELKSLLIRIKNKNEELGTEDYNSRINKYIKWHTAINNKKYTYPAKRNIVKNKIKEKIIELSELTRADQTSYERFGSIILLMIKNILKKPQFSGYTYVDDFYSDAIYKILKYLHNFNHKMISERTGQFVNAFAYISQIIHNSIIFIINSKKKENDNIKNRIAMENLDQNLQLKNYEIFNDTVYREDQIKETNVNRIDLTDMHGTLVDNIKLLTSDGTNETLEIVYPKEYAITMDEYNDLKPYLKGNINIIRAE